MPNWSSAPLAVAAKIRKYFTIEQANKSLVLLQRIVGEVMQEYQRLLELEELIEGAEHDNGSGGLNRYRKQLVETVDRVQECLEELELIGVVLRDFTKGIVDFPARQDGREIRLCWMFGEERVAHWHEVDAGFASRKELAAPVPG